MNRKELMEKRAQLVADMNEMLETAKTEKRAFSADENAKLAEKRAEIENIDKTIENLDAVRALGSAPEAAEQEETEEQIEVRAFANIIRQRGEITYGDNGAVVPKTIVNRIIDKVYDISPLVSMATKYNVKGTVSIPYVDDATNTIAAAYATEFTDLTSVSAKLLSVDLTGFLAGVLVKISKSLVNDTDIDLVDFAVNEIAKKVAVFLDQEILVGTSGKITGLSTATNIKTAAAAAAVTADELIALQGMLKSQYQAGAIWVMAPATYTAIKQLKDGDNRYIFNNEIKDGFSGTILGKPVYVSDQAAAMATGNKAIFYLDAAEALAMKVREDSVQILNEAFAAQHAIGVVSWIDADAKVVNQQAVAVLQMA